MAKSIYLASPMTGLQVGKADKWRFEAQAYLGIYNVDILHPNRDTGLKPDDTYLADCSEIDNTSFFNARSIRARNLYDVSRCDLVLANFLGAQRVSIGSVYELGYAAALGKQIVCVIEQSGNIHDHLMIVPGLDYRFSSLKEAYQATISILDLGLVG